MNRFTSWGLSICAFNLFLGAFNPAHAALLGATVDVSANYPGAGTVFSDPGSKVVSAAVEYPAGSYATYNASWQVDITDTQFLLTDATTSGFPFLVAPFNGFVLKVLSGPTITGASIDPSSDFSPIGVTVVGGNEIDINYSGVNQPNTPGLFSRINIQTGSIPEPTTLSIAAFGSLLFFRRKARTA